MKNPNKGGNMDKINVRSIFDKYLGSNMYDSYDFDDIIKEIVELVVDKCAEEVSLTGFAAEFMQEGAHEAVDVDSILKVKEEVNYE